MAEGGDHRPQGVPAWVGPLLIGMVVSAVPSFFGAAMGVGSEMHKQALQLVELKTSLDGLCDKVLAFMARKDATDTKQDQVNERQDQQIQRIMTHLRLPPP
jgi:hypothetical protein